MEMLTKQLPAFSSEQLDVLGICSIISLTSACTALRAGWRGDCSSQARNGSLLQSPEESLPVNPATRWSLPVCFLSHPSQNTPKWKQPGWKGILVVFIEVLQ